MCYDYGSPVAFEVIKTQLTYVVLIALVILGVVHWYKSYLGKSQGYDKKYSKWINWFHPFKRDQVSLSNKQKWTFKVVNIAVQLGPMVYLLWLLFSLYC